jgi:hypothetical protein
MADDRAVTVENPSAEDYESVHAAVNAMTAAGWRETTLNAAVAGWQQLVERVEEGYSLTVDDYTNDLSVRVWLERVLPMLTPTLQDSLGGRLAPLDDRFRVATVEPKHRMPGAGPECAIDCPRCW